MRDRLKLHELLCEVLASSGKWLWDSVSFDPENFQKAIQEEAKKHVFFQPPENLKLSYPCIIYSLSSGRTDFADNLPYTFSKRYSIAYIDKNPDSSIPDRIAQLPCCTFDRHYTADNLNHDLFEIYF